MNTPLTVKSEAAADIVESAEWYDGQRAALGDEFLRAVDEVFDRLREWPKLYAAGYRGVRQAGLKRFPYVVYYRVRPGGGRSPRRHARPS